MKRSWHLTGPVLLLATVLLGACASIGETTAPAAVRQHPVSLMPAPAREHLKVMTLNVAHGRRDGFHQAFLDEAQIRANLDRIAHVARREAPDVLALQEVDGPSAWSGDFGHVGYLADKAGFARSLRGSHMDGLGLDYGTALLARRDLHDGASHVFAPSALTPPKGFVVAALAWPGRADLLVDVVSVHMDFFRDPVQRRQAAELAELLAARARPLVVMGDLNVEWQDGDGVLEQLMDALSLSAYKGGAADLVTFPSTGRRIDWILVSPELRFVSHRVLPDTLSDHRAVIAEIALDVTAQVAP
jgi:endonuclease/exonuclease/phosphatase family metal-dependent hydrolase